jgi:predicted PurR-regulated permease PerM
MVSYWKTQWFRVLIGFVALGLCIYYLFQPGADESTLEGLNQNLSNSFAALCYFLTAMIWLISSVIEYNSDRIKMLEKKAEKYDAMYDLVQELLEANKVDRQYTDHLNRKIESFITDYKKKEKQK